MKLPVQVGIGRNFQTLLFLLWKSHFYNQKLWMDLLELQYQIVLGLYSMGEKEEGGKKDACKINYKK